MKLITNNKQQLSCQLTSEIAAYLDGELDAKREIAFENHLTGCSICTEKLNEQKRLLCTLDSVFTDEKNFDLPANFVKNIVVRAESNVSGLRVDEERQNAFFIVLALIFCGAVLSVVSDKTESIPFVFEKMLGKFVVVMHFVVNFCYDIGIGAVVIMRAMSRQMLFDSSLIAGFLALLIISLAALSRVLFESNRMKH